MLTQGNINKMNELLNELGNVRAELKKVDALKKKQRLLEKSIKNIMLDNEETIYENSEWSVVINKNTRDTITEDKVIEIIGLFDSHQLDSLSLEDFFETKTSMSMKIKELKKEDK